MIMPFSFSCFFFLGGLESQDSSALMFDMSGLKWVSGSSSGKFSFLFLLELTRKGLLSLPEYEWLSVSLDTVGGDRGVEEGQDDLKLGEGIKVTKVLTADCGGAEDLEADESTLEKSRYIKAKTKQIPQLQDLCRHSSSKELFLYFSPTNKRNDETPLQFLIDKRSNQSIIRTYWLFSVSH